MKMVKTIMRSPMQTGVFLIVLGLLFGHLLSSNALSDTKGQEENSFMRLCKQGELQFKADNIKRLQQKRIENIETRLEQIQLHKILKEKIRTEITPEDRILAFERELAKMSAEQKTEFLNTLKPARLTKPDVSYGSISGTTLLDGAPYGLNVYAYDEYGYYAGNAYADYSTGAYTIPDLLPGKYFVCTNSWGYVNEIYNDILKDNWGSWRQVINNNYLVPVIGGSNTSNIDFDIQTGATVSGTFYENDGVTPIANSWFYLNFKSSTDPNQTIFSSSVYLNNLGEYTRQIPYLGYFRLLAEDDNYPEIYSSQYYNNKDSWDTADIITIGSYSDVITYIDFHMDSLMQPIYIALGGISGSVTTTSGLMPALLGFAIAFDPGDTSIAGLGTIFGGSYVIPNLPDGEYIVYVDDMAGNLLGFGNFMGEYYNNVRNPAQATKVTVASADTTENINFDLEPGGSISGTVLGPGQTKLDSLLIVAFNKELLELNGLLPSQGSLIELTKNSSGQQSIEVLEPFLANVWFDVALTDGDGKYMLSGLPAGDYIVRTISLLKHEGEVLDEYYQNIHNILSIDEATAVNVKLLEETKNIDFDLEAPGAIKGKVTNSDGTIPLKWTVVIALDAKTGMPALLFPVESDTSGEYTIGPMLPGDYTLIALPYWDDSPYYLPEFYDGKKTLASANSIAVNFGIEIGGVNFTLDVGGFIQGLVELAPGYRAGADTISSMSIAAYDATTGQLKGMNTTTFAGGYRIGQLPPGDYKVAAIPAYQGFAATYHGGGDTFDDPSTATVSVATDDSARADITIESANGVISGDVVYRPTGEPIISYVMAYDGSGHLQSLGTSFINLLDDGLAKSMGHEPYRIAGLRTGKYYVRTYALLGIMDLVLREEMIEKAIASAEAESMLPPLPMDAWYQNVSIDPVSDYDLVQILFGYSSVYGSHIMPFNSTIPGNATAISVMSPNETSDIDFSLNDFLQSEVTIIDPNPTEYTLHQNYPNPFNPQTTIQYRLLKGTKVELRIFDLMGKEVATLVNGEQQSGSYEVIWTGCDNQGSSVASGIYLYRLEAGDYQATKRLVLIR